ncbi:MAG TPA: hypothetical protein VFI47_15840 [Acidimicrobiales bacterium]|nr:hypothetical protein [Acidimicrobiales bacterium]
MLSTAVGFLVFLLLLFFVMQVTFGLYASSMLRGTLNDAASRAASGFTGPDDLVRLAGEAEASLGEMGRRPSTVITLEVVDEDGDGVGDVVAGHAVAEPPRFVPPSVGGMVGFEQIDAAVRVRIERVR